MKVCIDAYYQENNALVAAILFENWDDEKGLKTYFATLHSISDYTPGQFYLRELPCIMAVLEKIEEPIDTILLDSYVQFSETQKGLGAHLYESIEKTPKPVIIGIAKTKFWGAQEVAEVLRGKSKNPLYITAQGIDIQTAAQYIAAMSGEHRIPTLLKEVDRLSRTSLI